jgi:hypothetical protein
MIAMTALMSRIRGRIKAGLWKGFYSSIKPLNQNKKPQTFTVVILPHGLRIFAIQGEWGFIKG